MSKRYHKDYPSYPDWDCDEPYKEIKVKAKRKIASDNKIECNSNSNPYIIINNNMRRSDDNPEVPNPSTMLLGDTTGTFSNIGEDMTLIGEVRVRPRDPNPILITASINWRPEGVFEFEPIRLEEALPTAEFMIARAEVGKALEEELTKITAAAPSVTAPTMTNIEYLDKDASPEAELIYKSMQE